MQLLPNGNVELDKDDCERLQNLIDDWAELSFNYSEGLYCNEPVPEGIETFVEKFKQLNGA
jgi:hypothetical protein